MAPNIYTIYKSLGPHFRVRRREWFLRFFQLAKTTTILDVGGYPQNWYDLPVPAQVTLLNIDGPPPPEEMRSNLTFVAGDGCNLPFADKSFDIAYSNSVIEHLPAASEQERFAQEALRVGRGVFVQTPNRWFPVEPHFIALGVHYFPKSFQRTLIRWCSLRGWLRRGDNVDLDMLLDELRLLTYREMRAFFPGCDVLRERVCGLTKSLIAVRVG